MRFIGLMLTLGLAGCRTSPGGSTASPPPLPPGGALLIAPETAASGRQLYVNKCARCHKFYDPAGYDAAEWDSWMTKMSKKAKLKPEQTAVLAQYLAAFRTPAIRTNAVVPPR